MRSRISRQVHGVILADVLGYPQGNFAVLAHEAQQIALPQEADLARFLGLGRRFILASGNYSGDSQWGNRPQRSAESAFCRHCHKLKASLGLDGR